MEGGGSTPEVPRRVDIPAGWKEHSIPVPTGEQQGRWRQSAPIPTYTKTQTDGVVSVKHLWYAYPPDNLNEARQELRIVDTAGSTMEEAEARMRQTLPFDIELGRGEISGVSPNEFTRRDADTVSQYFEDTTPQTQ